MAYTSQEIFQRVREKRYVLFGGEEKYKEAMKNSDRVPRITGEAVSSLYAILKAQDRFRANSMTRSAGKVFRYFIPSRKF